MIFSDFLKALSQMNDKRFLKVMGYGVGLTFILLAGLTWLVQFLLPDTISLPWFGEISWLTSLLSGFVFVVMIGMSAVLMVPVASLFTGLFLDQVADAVECKYYPNVPAKNKLSIFDIFIDSLKFFSLMVGVNLVALIVYLTFAPLAPFIFWLVNGFLLGREYFQMVAMRYLGRLLANDLRKRYRLHIFFAGIFMAIPLSIPFVNLFIPVLGVATFTHIFHRLQKKSNTRTSS